MRTFQQTTSARAGEGFVYNELEGNGLFGRGGRLTIQPEYQRNYIYNDGKKDIARTPRLTEETRDAGTA